MMFRYLIDWGNGFVEVEPPMNADKIKIQIIFTNNTPSATVQSINFKWTGQVSQKIISYLNGGLSGATPGIGEGIPLQLVGTGDCEGVIWFNGVIDAFNENFMVEADIVTSPIKKTGDVDWFGTLAEGIDYTLLRTTQINGQYIIGAPGSGAKYQYKTTAYAITYQPQLPHLVTMFLEEVVLVRAVYEAAKSTGKTVYNLGADVINIAIWGSGVAPGVSDLLALGVDGLQDFGLVAALQGNTELLMNQFGIIDKYKYCMTANDLINAAMYYINNQGGYPNLTFKSSILGSNGVPAWGGAYVNTTIMPKKILKQSTQVSWSDIINNAKHPPGDETNPAIQFLTPYGHYDGNFKGVLQDLMKMFNAEYHIIGNTVYFEQKAYYWTNPLFTNNAFQLPNVDLPAYNGNWPQPNGYNWSEVYFSVLVHFPTDSGDETTTAQYKGTTCQVQIQPKVTRNVINLLSPGALNIQLPFSRAIPKTQLSLIDQAVNDVMNVLFTPVKYLADIWNTIANTLNHIIKLFGGNPQAIPLLNYTIPQITLYPFLELSNDTFENAKIFIGYDAGSPPGWNSLNSAWQPTGINTFKAPDGSLNDDMSGVAIMYRFYGTDIVTPPNLSNFIGGNQWLKYKNKTMKIGCAQVNQIINYRVLVSADGKTGVFDSAEWNPDIDSLENIQYRVNVIYTNNLVETFTIDGN